jgi:hypothetical protein
MAETHKGVWWSGSINEITVADPVPLASARLFKYVSDAIWERRPENLHVPFWDVGTNITKNTVKQIVNWTVDDIDPRLKVANRWHGLRLAGTHNLHAMVPAISLRELSAVSVGTYNWDTPERSVDIDGTSRDVTFIDGHMDYDRQLELKLHFNFTPAYLVASYAMRRRESSQDHPIGLRLSAYHSELAETDYGGTSLHSVSLTPEQETTMLKMFASIGDIDLKHFEQ